MTKTDPELEYFFYYHEIVDPLKPRDALFGGRTNALKLYHKCEKDKKIFYYDFTSLYLYVQKYCKFPIGHPTILTENIDPLKKYFGIIKCKILPPRTLYIPVLPARINKKLVFPLCRTCAEIKFMDRCCHNDQERAITGTWCTPEVDKAVELGYKILKIYEVWH